MKTEKFEELVDMFCKTRGIVPSQDTWARMRELRERHVRFAIIVGGKNRTSTIEIRVYPGDELAHKYAYILCGNVRRGDVVLFVEYRSQSYVRLCTPGSWAEDYRAIVPERVRPRDVKSVWTGRHKVRKPVKPAWEKPIPRQKWTASDEDVSFYHPNRMRCPKAGFESQYRANAVMSWLGSIVR